MDTLIGALWAIGMAMGILLIKFTPGYQTELMSYLFGNIALISWGDVWLMLVLDAIILAAVLVFHKRLLAICLDQEQAELQGINVLWDEHRALVPGGAYGDLPDPGRGADPGDRPVEPAGGDRGTPRVRV